MVMCLCSTILPYIMHVFDFLNTKCIVGVDINMENYLFGFHGYDCAGLNPRVGPRNQIAVCLFKVCLFGL